MHMDPQDIYNFHLLYIHIYIIIYYMYITSLRFRRTVYVYGAYSMCMQ